VNLNTRKDLVYLILAGFFVCNAVFGELVGGKLFQVGPAILSLGAIPWPVVFITTDLINEYFGKQGVRRLTFITVGLIIYTFILLSIFISVPAAANSPVKDEAFRAVFGQSLWIIIGSVTAFCIGQLVDVLVFWFLRERTGGRHLWLRATGSTVVSQVFDTLLVGGIAFYLPGKLPLLDFLRLSVASYSYKLVIALGLTPIIYAAHASIDRYLGSQAKTLITEAAIESEGPGGEASGG
jgi:uncharacterized integral membrane protein (TIGR00697 family)